MRDEIERLLSALSPTMKHVLLRFSEAEEWGRSGYGMPRTWPDLVYGRRNSSHRTLRALERLGIAEEVAQRDCEGFRLTPTGLMIQLHLRRQA